MLRVNIFGGEACLTVTDLSLPSPFPLFLTHSYLSHAAREGPLGPSWDLLYDVHLDREWKSLVLRLRGEELHRFSTDAGRDSLEDATFGTEMEGDVQPCSRPSLGRGAAVRAAVSSARCWRDGHSDRRRRNKFGVDRHSS
jgi:hypothetical protein